MSTFHLTIKVSNVDIGLGAFKESASDGATDRIGETTIGVQSLKIERHFDVSDLLVQLAITAPVSVTTAVIAGQINEYLKRKLGKTSEIAVADTKVKPDGEEDGQDELTRALREAIIRAVEAERNK